MPTDHMPSWETVATILANRLVHHARCDRHPDEKPDAECPFCADRAAFGLWLRKSRAKLRRTMRAGADR